MDFVDDDEADELRVGAVPRLSRDDVPLFRGGDDHLKQQNRYYKDSCFFLHIPGNMIFRKLVF